MSIGAAHTQAQINNTVKINELQIAADCWIEIWNSDTVNTVDISGWYLQGHWDNPADGVPEVAFQFPGAPGSSTTVLLPEEFIVVSETAGVPALPVGTQAFTLTAIVPWFTGLPGTMVLADDLGNGVDYLAWSSVNAFDCPMELGTSLTLPGGAGVPAIWTGEGEPVYGGVLYGANDSINYRHTRVDTDNADDWTNEGAAGGGTPGFANPFQITTAACGTITPVALAATFAPTATSGCGPLTIGFENTSTGDCELGTGGIVSWDFDVVNAGSDVSSLWHDSRSLSSPRDVQLTIIDGMGAFSQSAIQTINVVTSAVVTPKSLPFAETWEGFPAPVLDPCAGGQVPDPLTGWEFRALDPGSRFLIVDWSTLTSIAWAFPGDASASSGPTVCILDTSSGLATNEMVLHFDATTSPTGEFELRYAMIENFDEVHGTDVFSLQDGFTLGNGTSINTSGGGFQSTGLPGFGGFLEVPVLDYNASIPTQRVWNYFAHVFDMAYFAANGLVPNVDMRFIFRQRDNVWFQGNDAFLIDDVKGLVYPAVPGAGEPYKPGIAGLDINGAINGNGNVAGNVADPNGPYFATANASVDFSIEGEANQAIILLAGNLNVGSFTAPGIGQLDIGSTNPAGGAPLGLSILADGTGSGFLNSMMNTTPAGIQTMSLGTPALPSGIYASFQAVVFNSASIIAFTNVVELSIP